jgi:putative spermidine/putrescine transport system permease protein
VTLPLIWPGVLAGVLFAFATSWDEVIVALFLTSSNLRTLPVVMWSQIQFQLDPTIAAVSTMLLGMSLLTFTTVTALQRLSGNRL